MNIAGWSSLVARRAHNPKVVGSNPAPATTKHPEVSGCFFVLLFRKENHGLFHRKGINGGKTRGGTSLYSSFCCKISPEFGQPDETKPEGHFRLDALQKICYFRKAQSRSAFMRRAALGQIKRKSYVSSVVGLLPFGGLDQLCTAQAESVFQPSVLFAVSGVVFFYCLFRPEEER